jgi:hypothetical protein
MAAGLLFATAARANDPFSFNNYAIELQNRGEHEKALEQLQRAFSLYPYDQTLRRNLAEAYTFVGERHLAASRFEEAIASFDQARELFPEVPRYYVLKGIAFYYGKYYDAALNELQRAQGLGGETPEILFFTGRVQYDTGNLQAAIESWGKALVLKPDMKATRELLEKAKREQSVEGGMDKGYSSRFVVSYDAGSTTTLAREILDTLEDAYNQVGSDLSQFPTARIPVILYTKKDYRLVTAGPDWSGGLYDGKIRLPVGGATELTPQLKGVLFHEYTHVVVQELTRGNVPTWLNEGVAELQGRRLFNPPMADLGKAAKSGQPLPTNFLDKAFIGLNTHQAGLAYQESYALANFMVQSYGWHKVREILQLLGAGEKIEAAVGKALADFGLDYQGLMREWQAYMGREFGER